MSNVLIFDIRKSDITVITPCIDGVLLTNLVEQFERARGMNDPAGGYGGLVMEFFKYGPLDQYFRGQSETPFFANASGRIYVLGCDCGEVGCWPLTCVVHTEETTITWQAFEQPYRPIRCYSAFGPFVFNREQYEQALRSLPN